MENGDDWRHANDWRKSYLDAFSKKSKRVTQKMQAGQLHISPWENHCESPWGTFLSTRGRRQRLTTVNMD